MNSLNATEDVITDPVEAAKAAGLRYVSDRKPGLSRKPSEGGFLYYAADGAPVTDEREIGRINSLGIPPAWTDVWIYPNAKGHIQATGRDARGRKQYRYHPRWRAVRDETKYNRMVAFGAALPSIRARVDADLARPGLPREKVLATVVRLLETTFIRIGNEEYARQNESYGLTTLHNEHAAVHGATVRFRFRGKSGKEHDIAVRDRRVAAVVCRCQDLPGQDLFEYRDDDGQVQTITSDDVNTYLREVSGEDFTAKDFRTWGGSVLAALALRELGVECEQPKQKEVAAAVKQVAATLGNTPAVCRKSYIHPAVIECYLEGTMRSLMPTVTSMNHEEGRQGLRSDEAFFMHLLQTRLTQAGAN